MYPETIGAAANSIAGQRLSKLMRRMPSALTDDGRTTGHLPGEL
ncbi:hypothetical protein [Nocardia sp. BMG51109]|nr:hypothetical protein [Nocardia sp. BMG51109]